jgi:DNA-binding GntR family transcriptional regulator
MNIEMLEQHGLYDQAGRPVEFARHLYRATRYAFTTSLPRLEAANG